MFFFFFRKKLVISTADAIELAKNLYRHLPEEIKQNKEENLRAFNYDLGDNMLLKYPGKKKPGDYCFEYGGADYKHTDICDWIYNTVHDSRIEYDECKELLEEAYRDGLYEHKDEDYEKKMLRKSVFWVSLQEEINYPLKTDSQGNIKQWGRLLSYCRYAEALYVAKYDESFSIEDVRYRAKSKKNQPPPLLHIKNVPLYYSEECNRMDKALF